MASVVPIDSPTREDGIPSNVESELGLGVAPLISTKSSLGEDTKDSIALEEEEKRDSGLSFDVVRIRAKKLFVNSRFGHVYEFLLLVLSFLSVGQYIYQTRYYNTTIEKGSEAARVEELLQLIEMCLAGLFGFDWLLSLFLAEVSSEFLFSAYSIIDLFTVIPIWFTYDTPILSLNEVHTTQQGVTYVMYLLSTTRVCRLFRCRRYLASVENDVNRVLLDILVTITVMIVWFAALMQYVELHLQPLNFFDWIYFAWITTTTVGYGDISPESTMGQVTVMMYLTLTAVLLPKLSNDLLEMMKLQSPWARMRFKRKGNNSHHVLICGDLSATPITELFMELFHEDHADMNVHAVVLQTGPPDLEMFKLLEDPVFSISMTYLEGSPLVEYDLNRACAESAVAIFIMTNKFTMTPDKQDSTVILQQFSIKRYIERYQTQPLFCIQLIREQNKQHLSISTDDATDLDLVVCINQIKMGVLAKAAQYPGASALIFNLLSSFADDADEQTEKEKMKKRKAKNRRNLGWGLKRTLEEEDDIGDIDELSEQDLDYWLAEYQQGCDWEIYTSDLSLAFQGRIFSEVALEMYLKEGIVVMGLKMVHLRNKHPPKLILNPGDMRIPDFSVYFVQAFVMAKNVGGADAVQGQGEALEQTLSPTSATKVDLPHARRGSILEKGRVPPHRQSLIGVLDKGLRRLSGRMSMIEETSTSMSNAKKSQLRNNVSSISPVTDATSDGAKALSAGLDKRTYLRLGGRITLEDATINGFITDKIPQIEDHLIITGKDLNNLYEIITSLRSKAVKTQMYIVILSPRDISRSVWNKICVFEGVVFIRGSALHEGDLRRAGIFRAKQVIVLAGNEYTPEGAQNNINAKREEALLDVDTIFSYQCVRRLNAYCNVIIELVREGSIAYLDAGSDDASSSSGSNDFKFCPQFAAGMLYTSTLLDTLLVQTFYNRDIIKVVELLVGMDGEDSFSDVGAGAVGLSDSGYAQTGESAASSGSDSHRVSMFSAGAQSAQKIDPKQPLRRESRAMLRHSLAHTDSSRGRLADTARMTDRHRLRPPPLNTNLPLTGATNPDGSASFIGGGSYMTPSRMVIDRQGSEDSSAMRSGASPLNGTSPQWAGSGSGSGSPSHYGGGGRHGGPLGFDRGKPRRRVWNTRSSSLFQVPIPDGLETMTYGAMFRHIAKHHVIPIGILRGVFRGFKVGPRKNSLNYVFANPPPDTELFTCDKIFVLAPSFPSNITATVNKPDTIADLRRAEEARQRIMEKEIIGAVHEELSSFQDKYKEYAQELNQTSDMSNTRLRVLFDKLNTIRAQAGAGAEEHS
jgi:hypothetical protein